MSSNLDIKFYGPSARRIADGLAREVFARLEPYKTTNHLFQFFSLITLIVAVISIVALMMFPVANSIRNPRYSSIMLAGCFITLILGAGYACLLFLKPYTTFKTRRNEIIERSVNFLLVGIIGFILFTVIGVYFRQRWLGF